MHLKGNLIIPINLKERETGNRYLMKDNLVGPKKKPLQLPAMSLSYDSLPSEAVLRTVHQEKWGSLLHTRHCWVTRQ